MDKINDFSTGLVRINPAKNRSKIEEEKQSPERPDIDQFVDDPVLNINLSPKTSASDLYKQLHSALFDAHRIREIDLQTIAGGNKNDVFDTDDELEYLDYYLETQMLIGAFLRLPQDLRTNREFCLETLRRGHDVLFDYFAPSLLNDRKFIIDALDASYGSIFSQLPPDYKKDKEILYKQAQYFGYSISRNAPEQLIADKQLLLTAIANDMHIGGVREILEFGVRSFNKDKEFILALLKNPDITWSMIKDYIDDSLLKDMAFLREAGRLDISAYEQFHIEGRLDSSLEKEYDEIIKALADLNIKFPRRIKNVYEIIHNRIHSNEKDTRPLAVVIFPKADWSGAYMSNHIDELINKGYRVVYYEAAKEQEAYGAIYQATQTRKADLLLLGGHGSQFTLNLGAKNDLMLRFAWGEEYVIGGEDEEEWKMLADRMALNSTILLDSCSTGAGRENSKNVANMFKRAVPQSTVLASVKPLAGCIDYIYDETGRIISIGNIDFHEAEFTRGQASKLCRVIKSEIFPDLEIRYNNTARWLNELLCRPDFYDIWRKSNADEKLSPEAERLIELTKNIRCKKTEELSIGEQNQIKHLNRILIEEVYPEYCPKGETLGKGITYMQ